MCVASENGCFVSVILFVKSFFCEKESLLVRVLRTFSFHLDAKENEVTFKTGAEAMHGGEGSSSDETTPAPDPFSDSSRTSSLASTPRPSSTPATQPIAIPDTGISSEQTSETVEETELNVIARANQRTLTADVHPSPASSQSPAGSRSVTPPTVLPRALREVAAMSSLPNYALPLLEMGFSRRHILQAMHVTGTSKAADTRRMNMLVTWLLEHPVSDDEVL